MKAARMIGINKPLQIQQVASPVIDPDDERDDIQVIVKVKACGICGTDLHQLAGTAKVARLPITPGHEIAGIVHEVGRAVASQKLGLPVMRPGGREQRGLVRQVQAVPEDEVQLLPKWNVLRPARGRRPGRARQGSGT
jgi:threonine dehydrogenase-like Zn-dependent dehydrogenase